MRVGQQFFHHLHIGAVTLAANQLFVVDHIERRASYNPLREPCQQGRTVDQATPRGVDHKYTRLEQRQRLHVEGVVRGGKQRQMERNNVGLAIQTVEVHKGRPHFGTPIEFGCDIVSDDVRGKAGNHPPKAPPDATGPHNPYGFTVNVDAPQSLYIGRKIMLQAVSARQHQPRGGQQQRHGVFGHGAFAIGRHIADGDFAGGGRRDVDVVEAGGAGGNQTQIGQAIHVRGGDFGVDEGTEHVGGRINLVSRGAGGIERELVCLPGRRAFGCFPGFVENDRYHKNLL